MVTRPMQSCNDDAHKVRRAEAAERESYVFNRVIALGDSMESGDRGVTSIEERGNGKIPTGEVLLAIDDPQ